MKRRKTCLLYDCTNGKFVNKVKETLSYFESASIEELAYFYVHNYNIDYWKMRYDKKIY